MADYFIAWWNLENYYHVENYPQREGWLQKELKNELKGWTQEILDTKTEQLSKIIQKLNEGHGPDILGVCEVENKPVLELLVQRLDPLGTHYGIAHHDCSDKRGIDVAFIYDTSKFTAGQQFSHTILKRTGTRDLFQVNFNITSSNKPLVLIGNHWPSRTGGELETEPFRILAGETLAYWIKRIHEITDVEDIPIIIMGDLNDEPFNRSVMKHALGSDNENIVLNATTAHRVFNLMWPFLGMGKGTHYFESTPSILDQFMVSRGILNGKSGYQVKKTAQSKYAVKIESFSEMLAEGEYPRPKKFGRPSNNSLNINGYSDHFPISMILEEIA